MQMEPSSIKAVLFFNFCNLIRKKVFFFDFFPIQEITILAYFSRHIHIIHSPRTSYTMMNHILPHIKNCKIYAKTFLSFSFVYAYFADVRRNLKYFLFHQISSRISHRLFVFSGNFPRVMSEICMKLLYAFWIYWLLSFFMVRAFMSCGVL